MQLLQNNDQEQAGTYSLSPDRSFYGRDYDTPDDYDGARESRKCLVSRRPSYIHITKSTISSNRAVGAAHLGVLDQLPNEVITAILQYCTVRTLLSHVLRVNHAAYAIVKHLPGFISLTKALRDNLARSIGHYTRIWSALIRISPYATMRHLLESVTCGQCGDTGAELRPAHAKVLCNQCLRRPRY